MSDSLFDTVQAKIAEGKSKEDVAGELELSLDEVRYLADVETYQAVQRALSRPASERVHRPRRRLDTQPEQA